MLIASILRGFISSLVRAFLAQRIYGFNQLLPSCLCSVFVPISLSHPTTFFSLRVCLTCNYYFCGHPVPPAFLPALGKGLCLFPSLFQRPVRWPAHARHTIDIVQGVNTVLPLPGPWGYPLAAVKRNSGDLSFRNHLSGESCVSGGLGGLDDCQARASHRHNHRQMWQPWDMVGIAFMRVFLS